MLWFLHPPLCYDYATRNGETERPARCSARAFFDGRNMARHYKEADPFYHSDPWLNVREERLRRDHYTCCDCMERYRITGERPRPATLVHHVIPRKERPDLALDIDNLRSL